MAKSNRPVHVVARGGHMPLKTQPEPSYAYRDKAPAAFNSQLGVLTAELLAEANRRHDAALHDVSMVIKARYGQVDWERFQGVRRGVK